MDLPELIETIRCTVLGEDNAYWEDVCSQLNDYRRTIVTYARTREDLICLVYDFEPMLILMDLTPENIGIANYMASLHRYKQSFSIGMCDQDLKSFKELEKNYVVSAVLMKDYMYIEEDYKIKLMGIPEFATWLNEKGSLMNGSV